MNIQILFKNIIVQSWCIYKIYLMKELLPLDIHSHKYSKNTTANGAKNSLGESTICGFNFCFATSRPVEPSRAADRWS